MIYFILYRMIIDSSIILIVIIVAIIIMIKTSGLTAKITEKFQTFSYFSGWGNPFVRKKGYLQHMYGNKPASYYETDEHRQECNKHGRNIDQQIEQYRNRPRIPGSV